MKVDDTFDYFACWKKNKSFVLFVRVGLFCWLIAHKLWSLWYNVLVSFENQWNQYSIKFYYFLNLNDVIALFLDKIILDKYYNLLMDLKLLKTYFDACLQQQNRLIHARNQFTNLALPAYSIYEVIALKKEPAIDLNMIQRFI